MSTTSIPIPSVGDEGFFRFKEPLTSYIGNLFNLEIETVKIKVTSVISLNDNIKGDFKDPFTNLYLPAGLTELDYKQDLKNDIPLVAFTFIDSFGTDVYFRVPLNYIEGLPDTSSVNYINRVLVLNLGMLPEGLDLGAYYEDIKDYIETRLGVEPVIKDVTTGRPEVVDVDTHELRENVRTSRASVFLTTALQLEQLQMVHTSVLNRLDELDIVLSDTEPQAGT